jgi:hypothetical protein
MIDALMSATPPAPTIASRVTRNDGMSDEPNGADGKGRGSVSKWDALFLALYVLCVGPVQRLPPDILYGLRTFYFPLQWVSQYRLTGTLLAAYTNLWLPRSQRAAWDAQMGVFVIEGNSLE